MPLPAILRRTRKSEVDIRRRSLAIEPGDPLPPINKHAFASSVSLSGRPSPAAPEHGIEGSSGAVQAGDGSGPGHLAPDAKDQHNRPRLRLAKFRHASDSQLSTSAREHAGNGTEVPPPMNLDTGVPPSIVTTAPTLEVEKAQKKKSRLWLLERRRSLGHRDSGDVGPSGKTNTQTPNDGAGGSNTPPAQHSGAPPAYGEHSRSSLALPVARLSESSRSDASSGERVAYASTTTTHTVSTTTTFFRLSRRRRAPAPLFPLPPRPPPREPGAISEPGSRGISAANSDAGGPPESPSGAQGDNIRPPVSGFRSFPLPYSTASPTHASRPILRHGSTTSANSARSSPSLAPPTRLRSRGRSSTMSSNNEETRVPTPPLPSGRTSTSTTGRSSLGAFFNLTRLRPGAESPHPRYGSPVTASTNGSKPNSFSLAREHALVIPERQEDESPAKYLSRLQEAVNRGAVAGILSKSDDAFSQTVLRSYMRTFAFYEDPMDMAIRKLLMQVELPKETQQIDRVLQKFADRYHECNPGIFSSPDQAYFIAFSLVILHTDVFNKNNKHKMQKQDYVKNTQGEGVSEDVLECFYDNICYTPFIHVEDDMDIAGERFLSRKSRKMAFPRSGSDNGKRAAREPVDPYTLIIDQRLDILRPNLKDVLSPQDPYNYLGTAKSLDMANLQRTFFKSGVLQILSVRSRPDAFKSPTPVTDPDEGQPAVVDIKVTKVGILWRKETKKKKTRSPWQEWGAILTGSQLYFFRNTAWTRSLILQYDSHQKHDQPGTPVIFKPPLEHFKPDALMSTHDAVALLDSSYKKHKNAFIFVRHGGFEETLLAESESEMNDWLAKLNYAAAFRTAGVRMRALAAASSDSQRSRDMDRVGTGTSDASRQRRDADQQMRRSNEGQLSQQILLARRQIMLQKIAGANEKLHIAEKQLDHQVKNSRHLQILAPIQDRSREQVILAAARMAAKLKWIRMEIWRLKCHRDILSLDLDEEGSLATSSQSRSINEVRDLPPGSVGSDSQRGLTGKQSSRNANSSQHSPRSPGTNSRPSSRGVEVGKQETLKAMADVSRQSSRHTSQMSWELPPLSFSSQSHYRGKADPFNDLNGSGSLLVQSPTIGRQTQISPVDTLLLARSSSTDEIETEILRETNLLRKQGSLTEPRQQDAGNDSDNQTETGLARLSDGEGADKGKARRSLHRSLRDGHAGLHHRHRRGRDSTSSAAFTEDGSTNQESEGLTRGTGSFTLHGKKASVITFGSEWQNMSPEERLKSRKQGQSENSKASTGGAMADNLEASAPSPRLVATHEMPPAAEHTPSTGVEESTLLDALYTEVTDQSLRETDAFHLIDVQSNRSAFSSNGAVGNGPDPGSPSQTPFSEEEIELQRTSAVMTSDEEYQSASEDVELGRGQVQPVAA